MEITSKKKAAIKKLLEITNVTQSSEFVMNLFLEQIIETLKEPEDIIEPGTFEPDEIFDAMVKEAKVLIHEEVAIKKSLHLLMYPLYHKYLTLEEINELVRFYKTPLGRKLISINPKLAKEGMEISQIWGQELCLKSQQRISKILEKKEKLERYYNRPKYIK